MRESHTKRGTVGVAVMLLVAALAVTLGVGITMAWRSSSMLEVALTRAFVSKGEAIALALAATSEQGDTSDLDMIQSSVDAHKVIYGVSYIFLLDSPGRPRIYTFTPTFPPGLEAKNAIAMGEVLPEGTRVRVDTNVTFPGPHGIEHAFDVAAPIGGGALGTVHVGMSADLVRAQVREVRAAMFAWGGGVAAGAALLSLLVSVVTIIRPLRHLRTFTHEIASGRLDVRAGIAGPTEVCDLGVAMNHMVAEIATGRTNAALQERLRGEMDIANRIQVSILPRRVVVAGLEISASMDPATEVGGDYYDVLPVDGGAWVGIGDVAGHGLTAGLMMMMVQSAVAALVGIEPDRAPHDLVCAVNRVLYENVRERLAETHHVTLCLVRYHQDGRLVFAGAHEELLVCPARGGACKRLESPGIWLGVKQDIEEFTSDATYVLEGGDLLVLYTDGVPEAMNERQEQFGIDRLCETIERVRAESVGTIRESIVRAVRAWTATQEDDVTVLILRHTGSSVALA